MRRETKRLILRTWEERDLEAHHRLFNDKEVAYWLDIEIPRSMEEAKEGLAGDIGYFTNNGYGRVAVELKETGEVIGRTGIRIMTHPGEEYPEVGYQMLSEFAGQGYATEASWAAACWGFEELGHDFLVSLIWNPNTRSQAVAKKNGYIPWIETSREELPMTIWRLTKAEWEVRIRNMEHDQ